MNENKLDYYMNLKYEVVVEPSDDGYVVYIPELPGCITQTNDASEIIPMITIKTVRNLKRILRNPQKMLMKM